MSQQPESKWREYFSAKEFERGKKKMWAEGWVIVEQRTVPGKASMHGPGDPDGASLLLLPILRLFNRSQPKEILLVRYERTR